MDNIRSTAASYYDSAKNWAEDTYLSSSGENRTSYGIKETLKNTEDATGNETIDKAQKSVNKTIGDAFGEKGVAKSVGEQVDKNYLRGKDLEVDTKDSK